MYSARALRTLRVRFSRRTPVWTRSIWYICTNITSACPAGHAPVDYEGVAGDVAGLVRTEPNHRLGRLLRPPDPPQWNPARVDAGITLRVLLDRPTKQRSVIRAGDQG